MGRFERGICVHYDPLYEFLTLFERFLLLGGGGKPQSLKIRFYEDAVL